jgi:hypothetical protein
MLQLEYQMSDSMFRLKKGREAKHESIGGTLDSVHQSVITSLRESHANQDSLKEQIAILETEINALESSVSMEDIMKLAQKHDKLRTMQSELKSDNQVIQYFSKNADIMLQYYGQAESTSAPVKHVDNNTFMKYLTPAVQVESGPSRKQMFDEYISRMKMGSGADASEENTETEHCSRCNVAREEVAAEGILVCPSCGSEEYMMVVSDLPSFRDPPKERNNYAYKKINHLNEILNQFQAKESTIIPDEVTNEVVCEIKKRRIQNIAELSEKDIREILKKLNRSKYYEHAAHIVSRLNGNPPPTITPEIEEKIRAMFQDIQAPFLLYCPNDRTNFLSYSYILYKFFELLELDEYKVYFPLLKSRDRLISHDQIWKKICDYLRWEYIVSI